jgi:murein DD-endopeptidase MepM/ murein hydrolase activator NlpD
MLNYGISSKYGSKRDYGLHEGIDYISNLGKKAPIINQFDGILHNIFYSEKASGNTINMLTNPRFFFGVNVDCYIDYCHLHSYSDEVLEKIKLTGANNRFIKKDVELGRMGNTGYCLTYEGSRWRRITQEEMIDEKEDKGVHLHFQVRILNEHMAKRLELECKRLEIKAETYCIKQWNQFYFNPVVFENYYNKLKN